ncbi:GtrA family protein [Mobilitalea sibirica]|uniref:GtrA family protein n=1 Tax=Mobilitalea sibirica TaxID=1462919 RepID=A0A8J7HAC2_9FIRM|nr:GtrA family protein [Mobilitalea sibirica]MBH1939791.1 GtrA family protein [Mobilitalea sibirica]
MNKVKGYHKIKDLAGKVINRETITYGIVGVLTTFVNFVSYELFFRLLKSNLIANGFAWVIAVTFAYIVNKRNVFHSKSEVLKDELVKVSKFFGARLVTLGIEQMGIYIFIEKLGIYRWIVKAALSVIVIVINYIFSKFYIFNKKRKSHN